MKSLPVAACCFALALGWSSTSHALRPVEITPHVGYQFAGGSSHRQWDAEILPNTTYGITGEYHFIPGYFARLSYHRQPTELVVRQPGNASISVPLAVGYLQGGVNYEHPLNSTFRGLVSLSGGASHFTPGLDVFGVEPFDSEWRFAFAAQAGIKGILYGRYGIRLHTQLLMNVMTRDSALFCGPRHQCDYLFGELMPQGEVGVGMWLLF